MAEVRRAQLSERGCFGGIENVSNRTKARDGRPAPAPPRRQERVPTAGPNRWATEPAGTAPRHCRWRMWAAHGPQPRETARQSSWRGAEEGEEEKDAGGGRTEGLCARDERLSEVELDELWHVLEVLAHRTEDDAGPEVDVGEAGGGGAGEEEGSATQAAGGDSTRGPEGGGSMQALVRLVVEGARASSPSFASSAVRVARASPSSSTFSLVSTSLPEPLLSLSLRRRLICCSALRAQLASWGSRTRSSCDPSHPCSRLFGTARARSTGLYGRMVADTRVATVAADGPRRIPRWLSSLAAESRLSNARQSVLSRE